MLGYLPVSEDIDHALLHREIGSADRRLDIERHQERAHGTSGPLDDARRPKFPSLRGDASAAFFNPSARPL